MIHRIAALVALCALGACRQEMHDQPRFEPLEATTFFADGRASRPQVPGTVARGELELDEHLYRGRVDGELATTLPMPVTAELLARGRERYDVFCSPCHDRLGRGDGMVVQRGMKRPSSFHVPRLRAAPPGYFFDVISRGYGVMYDYADRIPARDRWAIVAYLETLQLSQHARLEDVPPERRAELEQ